MSQLAGKCRYLYFKQFCLEGVNSKCVFVCLTVCKKHQYRCGILRGSDREKNSHSMAVSGYICVHHSYRSQDCTCAPKAKGVTLLPVPLWKHISSMGKGKIQHLESFLRQFNFKNIYTYIYITICRSGSRFQSLYLFTTLTEAQNGLGWERLSR